MDESPRVLRLELDGRWSAEELGGMLVNLSELYDLRLFLELLREDLDEREQYFPELFDFRVARGRRPRRRPYPIWIPWYPAPPVLDENHLSRLSRVISPEERLKVKRIEHASPGSADLMGVGEVIRQLREFILKLLERKDGKRSRELSEKRAELENDRLRIENARELVALGRDLGYSETELRQMVRHVDEKQELFVGLIDNRKLVGVSIPDGDHEDRPMSR